MSQQQILKTEIRHETDVVNVRKKARDIAAAVGFDNQDQIRVATAVSEIARNAYEYAKGGMVDFQLVSMGQVKLVITIRDEGPGIEKLNEINRGTYVSPQGMGLGISGAKKLLDEVIIDTEIGKGTTVVLKKIVPFRIALLSAKEVMALTQKLMTENNSPLQELQKQNQEILIAVSELREKKDELQRINQELEDTNRGVVALYAELDEKAEILRIANESKTSFLSDMTHEFRSPLNSILSISQILLNDAKKDHDNEREKQVNFIVKAARGLSDLVNDLLDIAKIEAGKISVRPGVFPIGDVISSLRGLMRPIGGHDKVELHLEEPEEITLNTDEAKLTQILRNLISNSLKYTQVGRIDVIVQNLPEHKLRIEVKDTGIGIASENLEQIFEEFYQVDNVLQNYAKGTGLGLPLSRKLARLLGGDLWAESKGLGQGSTFVLEIPTTFIGSHVQDYSLSQPSKLSTHTGTTLRVPGKKKVLIVDDDESIRYSIRTELEKLNVDIREARDGLEGWNTTRVYLPDLIVLDLVMPNKDGIEFIRECMGQLSTRTIPILLHTSKPLETEERSYLEQVTAGILVKDGKSSEKIGSAIKNFLGLE